MARDLPPRTAAFIRAYVHSLEQLEVLLFLSETPERSWTIDEIYDRIRSNPQSIASRLERMIAQGLVRLTDVNAKTYSYHPATPELAAAVQELGSVYKEFRVAVIEHIFAEPPSPIQGFADAFRLRKDQNDG